VSGAWGMSIDIIRALSIAIQRTPKPCHRLAGVLVIHVELQFARSRNLQCNHGCWCGTG